MLIKILLILSLSILFISCQSDVNNHKSNRNTVINRSIYIENGSDIRGVKIETHNIQKNSSVIQNKAFNINENGIIKIGQ